jgi:hypothetical protein
VEVDAAESRGSAEQPLLVEQRNRGRHHPAEPDVEVGRLCAAVAPGQAVPGGGDDDVGTVPTCTLFEQDAIQAVREVWETGRKGGGL